MAGYFTDDEGTSHGFLRDEGVFTPIDFPGAGSTSVSEVLDDGVMVGTYTDVGDDPFTAMASCWKTGPSPPSIYPMPRRPRSRA